VSIIIAFSGRKQGGKGTMCRFLTENAVALFGRPETIRFDNEADGEFGSVTIRTAPSVRTYSMAGPLKQFCHEVLGLSHAQCYGSNDDKNTPTRYRWEDLPHYPRVVQALAGKAAAAVDEDLRGVPWYDRLFAALFNGETRKVLVARKQAELAPKGLMTARHVLQEFGTGMIRQMWPDVWNQACLAAIAREKPDVALIDDVRFPDEAAAVFSAGGYVLRLLRAPFAADEHVSEKAMDGYSDYTAEIANHVLDVRGSCLALAEALFHAGVVDRRVDAGELVFPDGELLRARRDAGLITNHDSRKTAAAAALAGVEVREGLDN
jgi:hypothetical protein